MGRSPETPLIISTTMIDCHFNNQSPFRMTSARLGVSHRQYESSLIFNVTPSQMSHVLRCLWILHPSICCSSSDSDKLQRRKEWKGRTHRGGVGRGWGGEREDLLLLLADLPPLNFTGLEVETQSSTHTHRNEHAGPPAHTNEGFTHFLFFSRARLYLFVLLFILLGKKYQPVKDHWTD